MSAKWFNLAESDSAHREIQTDICVIGAGAAGIYITKILADQGRDVTLLEAGPAICAEGGDVGFEALFPSEHYPGATAGRFFGMGGSTSRWGGLLIPHTSADLRNSSATYNAKGEWQHIVQTVSDKAPSVLKRLGYNNSYDFESFADRHFGVKGKELADSGFKLQAALFLPFRRKNLEGLLKTSGDQTNLRIFKNAVVKSWVVSGDHNDETQVKGVVAVSRNNKRLSITARKFIIAAGAIESGRILLEIDEALDEGALRPNSAPGCFLADHLSVSIADVLPDSLDRVASYFAPRFAGNWMRSFRLLEKDPPPLAPRAFAHFIFSNHSRGFELAKEVLSALQRRRVPALSPRLVAEGAGDIFRLAYNRFVNSKLYIPPCSPTHLQLDMEQEAKYENRITLTRERDEYGRRTPAINWSVSAEDMTRITETADRFIHKWPGEKAGLPQLQARDIARDGSKPHDAYHPVGTCRMGVDSEAVVDNDLKVWGVQNLWVASTGVLPSAGTANPTFTMLCLTHKLAEHLQVLK